jgi:hypothetical protein
MAIGEINSVENQQVQLLPFLVPCVLRKVVFIELTATYAINM